MNTSQALHVMAQLAAGTDGWDEPRIALWVDKLGSLSNDDAIWEAANGLVDTWRGPGSPPWVAFKEAYDASCRNQRMSRPALPAPAKQGMLHSEYMDRLRQRAEAGDHEAAVELKAWARVRRTPISDAVNDAARASGGMS